MNKIHPNAVVSPDAKLGDEITIAPYAIIYDDVEIGNGTYIGPHAVLHNGYIRELLFHMSPRISSLKMNRHIVMWVIIRHYMNLLRFTVEVTKQKRQ